MVKGVLSLFEQENVSLTAGLENGIILMSNSIGPGQPIYINGNHLDEEIILSCKGYLDEGLHAYSEEI